MAGPRSAPSRRTFLRGAAGIATLGTIGVPTLAGCGGSDDSRLRATWWGDPELNQALRTAVDAFEQETGGLSVGSEFLPWDGYWDKLATQAAGEGEPDLMMYAGTYIPEYVNRDVLLGLDSYIGDTINVSRLDEAVRDIGASDGTTYAVIAAINSPTVLYNATLLAELGVDIPDHTWTWNDFARLGNQVHTSGDDMFGIQDAGGDLIAFQVWTRQRGQELFDDEDRFAIDQDDLGDWLAYWEKLRHDGTVPPAIVTAEAAGDMARSAMVRREAAFSVGWNQDLGALSALIDDDIALTMLPSADRGGQPGQWLNAASMWAGSSKTKRPDDVATLIDFLINDDAAVSTLGVRLGVPPLAEARERLRGEVSDTDRLALDYIDLVRENSRPLSRLWPQGFTEMREILPRLNEAIGLGDRTVAEAVDDFFAEAERAMA